jgi:hypothetical protein
VWTIAENGYVNSIFNKIQEIPEDAKDKQSTKTSAKPDAKMSEVEQKKAEARAEAAEKMIVERKALEEHKEAAKRKALEQHEEAQARAAAAERKSAERKALEDQKEAEARAAAEKLVAERKALEEQKAAEARAAAEKLAAEKKAADQKKAEAERNALEEQKAAEARAAAEKLAAEKKAADQKKAEAERNALEEQKAAEARAAVAKSHETKTRMDQDLSLSLPRKVHVSNKVLARVFSNEFDTSNYTVFEVITVQDDGHRLLRSLSQSNVFRSLNPDLSGNVTEIRQDLHKYAFQNPNIVGRILKSRWGGEDITTKPEYIEFLNNLLGEENVGDRKFIELFSLRFGLPVVWVRDHQNQAEVFSSHDNVKGVLNFCRLRQKHKGPESKLWDPPSDISEAIFLWEHTTTAYTLLEPSAGQHDITPESLVITDVYVKPLRNDNHYDVDKKQSAPNSKSDEEDLWDQELFNDVDEEKKAAERKPIQEKKEAEAKAAAAEKEAAAERKALQEKQAAEAKAAAEKLEAEKKAADQKKAEARRKAVEDQKVAEARAAAENLEGKKKESERKTLRDQKKADARATAAAERLALEEKKAAVPKFHSKDTMPEYVCLPTCVLSNLFQEGSLNSKEHIVFKTHSVLGDGNCLYRCLSESAIFAKENGAFAGKYKELRTWISLHAESPALKALAIRVCKLWKSNGQSDTALFENWMEEIRTPTLWGGTSELILFAASFGIHVISVEQVEDTINLSTTTDAFAKLKIRPTITNKPGFGIKPPSDIKEVIFLWNHDYGNPTKRRKSTDESGNHYTLLEISEQKYDELPKSTFYFKHDISSYSTPIKKPTSKASPMVLSSTLKSENKDSADLSTIEMMKYRTKRARKDILKQNEDSDSDVGIRPKRKKSQRPVLEDTDDSDTSIQKPSAMVKHKSRQKKSPKGNTVDDQKSSSIDDIIIPRKPNKKRENPLTSPYSRKKPNNKRETQITSPKKGSQLLRKIPIGRRTIEYNDEFPKPPEFVYLSSTFIEKDLPVILPDMYKPVPDSEPTNPNSEPPAEKKLLYFSVADNLGDGNCFYLSICDSSVFRMRFPNWEGGYMALRQELMKHAIKKPELTRGILDVHFTDEDKFKWACSFLTMTFTNPKFVKGKAYRKGLYANPRFWKELNLVRKNRKKPSNHEIEAAILQRMQDDENSVDEDEEDQEGNNKNCKFVKHVVETFLEDDDIEEMAWQWWPIAIGTDKFWGGLGEQILFTDRFGLQVVVLQLKDENVWNFSSHVIVDALPIDAMRELDFLSKEQKEKRSDDDVRSIIKSQKSRLNETIFLWTVNPKKPTHRLDSKGPEKTEHFMCLNLFSPPKTKNFPKDAFSLEVDN